MTIRNISHTMTKNELLIHLRHYAVSGIISDLLVPFFDQHGRWHEPIIRWPSGEASVLRTKIQKTYLPPWRRTRISGSGVVLRTSYHCDGMCPLNLAYCLIEGSLVVPGNVMIQAPELAGVNGSIITGTNQLINLPSLSSVGGNFDAMCSFLVSVPHLARVGGNVMLAGQVPISLETVGGRVGVYTKDPICAPKLSHVGRWLVVSNSQSARFPVLARVDGGVLITPPAKMIDLPCLLSVGGDFFADGVTDIRAPKLQSVGGDLETISASEFYFPKLHVSGVWTACPSARDHWMRRQAARNVIIGAATSLFI